jgi:hypothetical protein
MTVNKKRPTALVVFGGGFSCVALFAFVVVLLHQEDPRPKVEKRNAPLHLSDSATTETISPRTVPSASSIEWGVTRDLGLTNENGSTATINPAIESQLRAPPTSPVFDEITEGGLQLDGFGEISRGTKAAVDGLGGGKASWQP